MVLAHNAVMVGLHVDPVRLYESDDRSMLIWVEGLVGRLRDTLEEKK